MRDQVQEHRSRFGKAMRISRPPAYWKCLVPIWIAAPVSSSRRSGPMSRRHLMSLEALLLRFDEEGGVRETEARPGRPCWDWLWLGIYE